MNGEFDQLILFQVKPDKTEEFEAYFAGMRAEMAAQPGCAGVRCFKRFYTFDGVETGAPPRELTKIVKCVKYYALWTFSGAEACGAAAGWLIGTQLRPLSKLLIMPFDLSSGYAL